MSVGTSGVARTVPPVPGTNELYALLDFLNHKDEYKKLLDKIEQARRDANDAIAVVGKAKDIDALHKRAERDRKAAADERANARSEADSLLDVTRKKVSEQDAALNERVAEFEERTRLSDLNNERREAAVTGRENAAASLEAGLVRQRTELADSRARVEEKEARLDEQIKKLRAAGVKI